MRGAGEPKLQLVAGGASAPSPSEAPLEARPDDELLGRARGGERDAFEVVVRRYQGRVIHFATRFFGQRAIALDVAQDVFVDLLRALPRYRPEGRFQVYLYRLMINRCRMTARAYRYQERARERLFVEHSARAGSAAAQGAPERERQRRLQRALLELPEKQRAVLQLRFWGGLSHEEIAEVLGTRVGTVKSRVWNGLARLREALGDGE
jgi:RNA polymerase sigma-70 factor (ECF subfamily)